MSVTYAKCQRCGKPFTSLVKVGDARMCLKCAEEVARVETRLPAEVKK